LTSNDNHAIIKKTKLKEAAIMKTKKKILLTVAVIIAAAITVFAVWYFFPVTFLRDIEPSDVKSISIANDCSGNEFVVEDPTEIEYIVKSIQNVKMRKDSISEGKKGWLFNLEFYDIDGTEIDRFYVEGDYKIRKDPYYYSVYRSSGRLCAYYLGELEKKYSE
jgi:hypothetical protein